MTAPMDDDFVTRAEALYSQAADGQALGPEQLDHLCAQHPDLAPVLQQVHRVAHHLSMPLQPPEVPGYSLTYLIGEGGMGRVWAARHETLDRMVAIKVMAPGLADDTQGRARMLREARAMARVRHQHVVPIYDVVEHGDLLGIAMELVPGDDLSTTVDRWRRGDAPAARERVRFVIRVANQIAQALSAAHAAGVLHRDVKPSNVRIRHGDREAMLVDFGVARSRDERTMTEGFVGTARFAAPEQIRGLDVDERTDLFALGRTIEWALEAATDAAHDPTDPGSTAGSAAEVVPPDLRAVVAKALEPDPRDRYVSASAMARDLQAVLDGRPVSARPRPAALRAWHWVVRDRVRLGMVGALALAAVLALVLWSQWPRLRAGWDLERQASIERQLQRAHRLAIDPATRADAAAAFGLVEDLHPASIDAKLGRAGTLLLAGDLPGARAALDGEPALWANMAPILGEDAGEAEPSDQPAARALTAYFGALRFPSPSRFAEAVERLEDLVYASGSARELYYGMLGYAASRADRLDVLLRVDDAMRHLWPASPSAHCWRTLAWQDRDPGRAHEALRRTLELDPTFADSFLALAIELRARSGDLDGAATEVERQLAEEHHDAAQRARLLIARSTVELARRDPAAARVSLQRALELAPDSYRIHARLADQLWPEDPAQAVHHLQRWTELTPDQAQAWRFLGMRQLQQKDYAASIESLEVAAGLAPQDGVVYSLWGEALFKARDPRAEETLLQAGSLEPDSARAHYFLAQIWTRAGDREAAVQALEEALARLDAGGYGVRRSSIERALASLH